MSGKQERTVVWVGPSTFVEGRGFRVSIVTEGESGHRPTGIWPYKAAPGETLPWFWGPTLEDAQRACDDYNERMGVSRKAAAAIVLESMS